MNRAGEAGRPRAGRFEDIPLQVIPRFCVGQSGRQTQGGQTPPSWAPVTSCPHTRGIDAVRNEVLVVRDLRKALCMGGVFAVSTVIPGKVQHLAQHLGTLKHFAPDEVLEHVLQLLGCFLVLSVLIWASKSEPQPVRPLLAYPPHHRDTVLVHVAGLALGVVRMLL